MIFVDTNVWLRSVQPGHPLHQSAVSAVAGMLEANETLVITPQIAAEFWNVATRPSTANGLGLSVEEARTQLTKLEGFLTVLPESQEVFTEWKRLVVRYGVHGVQAHDTRIVAAMNVHSVDRLLTFNAPDFKRFTSIAVMTPGT